MKNSWVTRARRRSICFVMRFEFSAVMKLTRLRLCCQKDGSLCESSSNGSPLEQAERISAVGGGRHVQRAIKVASTRQVVRSRVVGTSVSDLHRRLQRFFQLVQAEIHW